MLLQSNAHLAAPLVQYRKGRQESRARSETIPKMMKMARKSRWKS